MASVLGKNSAARSSDPSGACSMRSPCTITSLPPPRLVPWPVASADVTLANQRAGVMNDGFASLGLELAPGLGTAACFATGPHADAAEMLSASAAQQEDR